MSEKALIAQRFVLDLGPYAAALALFAAWVSYRANPLRAVNRYFATFLLGIALWQMDVALARSTRNYAFWGPIATPFGGFAGLMIFLINDAAIEPNARFWQRIRRNPLAVLLVVIFLTGAALTLIATRAPEFYPYYFRLICTLLCALTLLHAAIRRRTKVSRVNPNELMLFHVSTVFVVIVYTVFMLVRTPAGSRILSAATIVFTTGVIAMQLSERVLDAKGSAKIALGYVLTVLTHLLLTLIPVGAFLLAGGEFTTPVMWGFLVLAGLVSYPLFVFAQRVIRLSLSSLTARAAKDAREAAVEVAGTAENEEALLAQIVSLSTRFLQGQEVAIEVYTSHLHEVTDGGAGRLHLARCAERGWLSPEGALRRFSGQPLDHILEIFKEERLGAVIRSSGPRFTLVVFVHERGGGAQPITSEEIECIQEIAAIAATGIERVRALEHAFRVHGMAEFGRIAAQYSHESRNQIEAILCVLEALRDGYEDRVTRAHRLAVYQQAVDLAANHNLALEMVRLRPERVELKRIDLGVAVAESVTPFQNGKVQIRVQAEGARVAYADARLLRQVLLNLLRNSVQASLTVRAIALIEIRFGAAEGVAFVDVLDDGPGVAAEIHDTLFSRWTTTKSDGTGLGLAFCREAMNSMKGDISYLTPKGGAGARFRLALPVALAADGG